MSLCFFRKISTRVLVRCTAGIVLPDFGSRVVAIDGLFDYEKEIDLFFLPSFSVDQQIIDNFHSKLVYGWDCYPIDDDPLPLNSWRHGNEVVALTGGSDVTDLGQTWPTVLDRVLPKGMNVNWVIGPFAKPPKIPVPSLLNFKIHSAPESLGELVNNSHFATTIFGVSFFELLFRHKPTVVFSPYGLKDSIQLRQISEQGIAIVAEDCIDASEKLRMLIEKPHLAQELVVLASRVMKQSGGSRFCKEVAKLFGSTSLLN